MTTTAPASLSLLPAAGRKHSQRDACLHIPSGSVHVAQNLRVQGAGIDTVLADGTSSARVKHRHTHGSLLGETTGAGAILGSQEQEPAPVRKGREALASLCYRRSVNCPS